MDAAYSLVLPKWVTHRGRVSCVSIHPSGNFFATGGWDQYVKIWNFDPIIDENSSNEKLLALLHDHSSSVNCVRFSPDGKYLASAGDDGVIFLWQRVHLLGKPNTFGIPDEELKPNKPVQTWTSKSLHGHERDVTSISWSPDSQKIASCCLGGLIIVWDIKTFSKIWTSQRSIGILSLSWDPLNRFIAAQEMNLHLVIFDVHGKLVKEVEDCLDGHDQALVLRIAWSPDGSFVGAAGGRKEKSFILPFYQRESFNFAFALEGHRSPVYCLSCPPFLLKTDDQNYSSLFAIVDKCGVVSIWMIGAETKPLFVLDQLSSSSSYDLTWSKDGSWLFIALANNPVTRTGGIICVHFLKDFGYPKADLNEMDEIKSRLLGETSFRLKSKNMKDIANILQSLEIKEKEVDLEVLQLTTKEVLERQVETEVDGILTIRPVLLTAVEKQNVSFQCNVPSISSPNSPYEFRIPNLKWPKPSILPKEPSHILQIGPDGIIYTGPDGVSSTKAQRASRDANQCYCVVAASGTEVFKLSYRTGMRIASPFSIHSACRHLSISGDVVLAVGQKCYILELESMNCVFSCECPNDFVNFSIITRQIIIGHSRGKVWIYDSSAGSWVGGVLTNDFDDASMAEIERFAQMDKNEIAACQWYDFGISAIFYAYKGDYEQTRAFLSKMKENQETSCSKSYIEKLEQTIENKWKKD